MNAGEHSAPTVKSPRCHPSTVRLGSRIVSELCAHVGSGTGRPGLGAAGLLFGTAERDLLKVEAFAAADAAENVRTKRDCLDRAFEHLLASKKKDPDAAQLELVGWYCVRGAGDTAPLLDSDIEFHNRRFRRATDIAMILRPEQRTGLSMGLYGKSVNTALSRQQYRSGTLYLETKTLGNEPVNVTMRASINDEFCLKIIQTLDAIHEAERPQSWKRIALAARTKIKATIPRYPARVSVAGRARTKLPLVSAAVLLVLAVGVSFAWLYSRGQISPPLGSSAHQTISAVAPLSLQVKHQQGSLVVTWDRHSVAMQSATRAILQIDDGSRHRELQLDSGQIENGSILYQPTSQDVTFRLEILGKGSSRTSESIRVADGSSSIPAHPAIADTRSSTPEKRLPPQEKQARLPEKQVHRAETQVQEKSPAKLERKGSVPNPALQPRVVHNVTFPEPQARSENSGATSFPRYAPAKVLKQVLPSSNALPFPEGSTFVDVEVEVRIDDQGRVIEAHVVNEGSQNSGPFTSAALAAAKEWVFAPAQARGKNVPSDHRIKFHFRPQVR